MKIIALCLGLLIATPAVANSVEGALCGAVSASVAQMASGEKLCRALVRSFSEMPAAGAEEMRILLTPENLATMAALTSVWLGTQSVPVVGEAVDLALVSLGVVLLAVQAGEVSKALWTFANRTLLARTDGDLKEAASALAWAVSKVGVNVVAFVLTKKMASQVARPRAPPNGPSLVPAKGGTAPQAGAASGGLGTTAPAVVASGVLSQGPGGHQGGVETAPPKRVDAKAFAEWIAKARKTLVRENSPATRYQVKQAGTEELTVSGGGKEVRADGARASDAHLLEVKHVDKPATSPYVPDSKCNADVREMVRLELLGQLQRYAAVIADPATPVVGLEIITNEARAVPYLQALMRQAGAPGQVVVRP
jgi:hypothetical protein